jgi:hypothetical protein
MAEVGVRAQTPGAKVAVHAMDGGCLLLILRDETGVYTGAKTVYMAGWRGAYQLVRRGGGGGRGVLEVRGCWEGRGEGSGTAKLDRRLADTRFRGSTTRLRQRSGGP